MRLIQCHIENFGKLRDVTFDFDAGGNYYCKENGWGKSTFAAFIRVMLYGFEGESKRNTLENERKRYEPWQGGTYGGSLTFEANGKRYVATRVFRDKAANDSYELRDADTNLESNDYSQNLGEELFQINSESFLRTVFISQNDCVTNTTDSINAKIGNLTDNTNDLNSYEVADEALKNILNKMNPRKKIGTLYLMQEEITGLKTQISNGSNIESSIQDVERLYQEQLEQLEIIREKKAEVSREQGRVSKLQDTIAKKEAYEQLLGTLEDKKMGLEAAQGRFTGDIPTFQQLEVVAEKNRKLIGLRRDAAALSLTEEERQQLHSDRAFFDENLSPTTEINDLLQRWSERTTLKNTLGMQQTTLTALKATFAANKANLRKEQEQKEQAGIESAKAQTRRYNVMLGVAVFLLIVGIALCVVKGIEGIVPIGLGIVPIGLGIGLAIWSIFGKKKIQKPSVLSEVAGESNLLNQSEADIRQMEEQLKANQEKMDAIDSVVNNYLDRVSVEYTEETIYTTLQQILNRGIAYENLLAKSERASKGESVAECERLQEEVSDFLLTYLGKKVEEANYMEAISSLREDLYAYNLEKEGYETALAKKEAYERDTNIQQMLLEIPEEGLASLDALHQEAEKLENEVQRIQSHIAQYEEQIAGLQEQYDEWVATKEILESKELEFKSKKQQYKQLEKTRDLLTKAKENLTARYMEPIMNSFTKYYEMGAQRDAEGYRIDANTNVTVEEHGLQRETKFLSTGYQDLIGLCLRLALIDAMYQGEKPMLIFDDPFVNLDEAKTAGGKKLLAELSKEYQVIYFTCRGERG